MKLTKCDGCKKLRKEQYKLRTYFADGEWCNPKHARSVSLCRSCAMFLIDCARNDYHCVVSMSYRMR